MATNGLLKRLVGIPIGEMKGLSPAPFVEQSGKVIVGVHKRFVLLVSLLGIV
jgi:hypothetical protein